MQRLSLLLPILFCFVLSACGVYSFTGATIEGKNMNMHVLENRARNIVPSLAPTLTSKIRSKILSQTGLASVTVDNADYDITGTITGYEVTVSGITNTQTATQNRLTITVNIVFKNRLDKKGNFTQSFTRFADFPADQTLQSVESRLMDDIGKQLAEDIFNKAFVNW